MDTKAIKPLVAEPGMQVILPAGEIIWGASHAIALLGNTVKTKGVCTHFRR